MGNRGGMAAGALLAMAIGLAGCGSGSKNAGEAAGGDGASAKESVASAPAADPCSYLTPEDVSAITGGAKTDGVRNDMSCKYAVNGNGDGLEVSVDRNDAERQMRGALGAANLLNGIGAGVADKGGVGADAAAAITTDPDAPPKLGDAAAWGPVGLLYVRKGDAFIQITPPTLYDMTTHKGFPVIPAAEKRKMSIAAAEKVLAKL